MANTQPRKSVLWTVLKAHQASHDLDLSRPYVTWTESDMEDLMTLRGIPIPSADPTDDEPIPGFAEAAAEAEDEWVARAAAIRAGTPARPPEQPSVPTSRPNAAPLSQGLRTANVPRTGPRATPLAGVSPAAQAAHLQVPVSDLGEERAGLHFNDEFPDAALRVDSRGRIWYQDEVRKPASPKARMTRTTTYIDPGIKTVSTSRADGGLDETFEVAGDERKVMQTKTTLPSWQVGIFTDLRFPFKVHIYNDAEGFDFNDVVRFYGGIDLVPDGIKRKYVGNDLCFDMRTTRSVMDQEHREMLLQERNSR